MIPALVLTAGLATRLRPLSFVRAKAAMPIAGEPIVRWILRALRASGVRDVVLNLHHLPHTIARVVGDGSDLDVRVRYSWEDPILGSAGGPRQALPILGGGTSLIVNGDTLTDLDVDALIDDHRRGGALVTMAVVPMARGAPYGGVRVEADGAVTGFTRPGSDPSAHHFIGVQAVEPDAWTSVAPGAPAESVSGVYQSLIAARRGAVRAFRCHAEFRDIGTPRDYLTTSLGLAGRRPGGGPPGAGTRIHDTARVAESVLWDEVIVEAGSSLRRCIVADGVVVPARTSWDGVILRRADGPLAPGEQQVGGLAVARVDA